MSTEFKEKVITILEDNLGKEFKIPELCESYDLDFEEFMECFFLLEKDKTISWMFENKGSVRLISVKGKEASLEEVQTGLYKFPKDRELFSITQWGLTLDLKLRIIFDQCMEDDKLTEKLKGLNIDERLTFLNARLEFFAKENEEIIKGIDLEKKALKRKEEKELTKAEIKELKKTAAKNTKNIKPTKIKEKSLSEKDKAEAYKEKIMKQLERERLSNQLKSGIRETNKEKYLRLAKIEAATNYDNLQKRNEERKKFVREYSVGQIVEGKITNFVKRGVFVDIGKSDGLIGKKWILKNPQWNNYIRNKEIFKFEIIRINLNNNLIDLIPIKEGVESNTSTTNNQSRHTQKAKEVITAIVDNGGKESLHLLGRLIKENISKNPQEWSLNVPLNNRNRIRLVNSGLEGGWVDKDSMMIVILNRRLLSKEAKKLIADYVPIKKRRGEYPKLPNAIPLVLPHSIIKKNKKLLFDNYCLFLKEALKTGKNKSKKSHSPYAVEFLSKKTKQKLNQPEY